MQKVVTMLFQDKKQKDHKEQCDGCKVEQVTEVKEVEHQYVNDIGLFGEV